MNQGQNPLPIYLALNVKDKVATKDFRGNISVLEKSYVLTGETQHGDTVNNDKLF